MDYFIDWLTVQQNHLDGGLPIISKTINPIIDPETNELIRIYYPKKKLSGSFSSSIDISCDGFKVYVHGNPSRWNRYDNLFGFKTFDECIRVYNLVLAEFGLPPFTKNTGMSSFQGRDGSSVNYVPNGAVFSRVDWTQNNYVGKGNEDAFLRGLSTQSVGRQKPNLYTNGKTVDWGKGSTLWYLKDYNKGHELGLGLKRKRQNESKEYIDYLERLIVHCAEQGTVRSEKEFKNDYLKKLNLNLYGKITEKDFIPYLNDINKILERIDMSTSDYTTIAEQLLKSGAVDTERKASKTCDVAFQWLHGSDVILKKSQYFEHKRRLKYIGIDISIPFDASKRMPQIKNEREISFGLSMPPTWYRMPQVAILRAA